MQPLAATSGPNPTHWPRRPASSPSPQPFVMDSSSSGNDLLPASVLASLSFSKYRWKKRPPERLRGHFIGSHSSHLAVYVLFYDPPPSPHHHQVRGGGLNGGQRSEDLCREAFFFFFCLRPPRISFITAARTGNQSEAALSADAIGPAPGSMNGLSAALQHASLFNDKFGKRLDFPQPSVAEAQRCS